MSKRYDGGVTSNTPSCSVNGRPRRVKMALISCSDTGTPRILTARATRIFTG